METKNPDQGTYKDPYMPQYPLGCCITGQGQQQWQKGDCMWEEGTCSGKWYTCAPKPLYQCPTKWYEVEPPPSGSVARLQ